jgi:hypothetical protein
MNLPVTEFQLMIQFMRHGHSWMRSSEVSLSPSKWVLQCYFKWVTSASPIISVWLYVIVVISDNFVVSPALLINLSTECPWLSAVYEETVVVGSSWQLSVTLFLDVVYWIILHIIHFLHLLFHELELTRELYGKLKQDKILEIRDNCIIDKRSGCFRY